MSIHFPCVADGRTEAKGSQRKEKLVKMISIFFRVSYNFFFFVFFIILFRLSSVCSDWLTPNHISRGGGANRQGPVIEIVGFVGQRNKRAERMGKVMQSEKKG